MATAMYNDRMAKKRTTDRHLSKFVIRLPDVYRLRVEQFQRQYHEQNGIRPDYTACIKKALNDLFEKNGIDIVSIDEERQQSS